MTHSNVVRLTARIENLALGRAATASSTLRRFSAGGAVDGKPWTYWAGDNFRWDGPTPIEWLLVDLGAEKSVGAVSVLWEKHYAREYTVHVSGDGEVWREVASVKGWTAPRVAQNDYYEQPLPEMSVFRFTPTRARYVRLHCTEPRGRWLAYAVRHFGVYESLPGQD